MAINHGFSAFDRLIERYRSGQITRRELLRDVGLAAGLAAGAGRLTSARAQDASIEPAGKTGGTFTYGLDQSPETIDPEVTTYAVTNKININTVDPLIWQAPDLSYVPGVAEAWEVSEDAKAYTFHLRKDVKFHDGTPVNADAVKFSWDRIMDPETKSKTAIGQMGSFAQAVIVDEFTVRAEFSAPYAPFLDSVSQSYCSPISPTAVAKYGADFAHNLVGTGPFMLKEWVENDHVTLVKNPDYNWAPSIFGHQGPAYLEESSSSSSLTVRPELERSKAAKPTESTRWQRRMSRSSPRTATIRLSMRRSPVFPGVLPSTPRSRRRTI
jgi:peptide/nickel transport system substrate-binding protein